MDPSPGLGYDGPPPVMYMSNTIHYVYTMQLWVNGNMDLQM